MIASCSDIWQEDNEEWGSLGRVQRKGKKRCLKSPVFERLSERLRKRR
jgi:hypothetical protein